MKDFCRERVEFVGTPVPQETSTIGFPDVTLIRHGIKEVRREGVFNKPRSLIEIVSPWGTSQRSKEEEVGVSDSTES